MMFLNVLVTLMSNTGLAFIIEQDNAGI